MLFPKEIKTYRLIGVIALACMVIAINWYGGMHTRSDVPFTEMIHLLGDLPVSILLFLLIKKVIKGGRMVGKIAPYFLLLAGVISILNIYHTSTSFNVGTYFVRDPGILAIVSITTIMCVWLQLRLVPELHELSHGHGTSFLPGNIRYKEICTTHASLQSELVSDLAQASAGILIALCVVVLHQTHVRYADMSVTFLIGIWMVARGINILTETKQ